MASFVETRNPVGPFGPDTMPIDREEFQSGTEVEDGMEMVLEYLYETSGQAFTVPAFADEIGSPDRSRDQVGEQTETLTEYQLDLVVVRAVLVTLDHRDAVRSRDVETAQGTQKYHEGTPSMESPEHAGSADGEHDG